VPERHVVFSAKDRIRASRSGPFNSIAAKLRADEEVDNVALAADASTGSGSNANTVHSSKAKRRDTIVEFNGDMSMESSSASASSSVSGAVATAASASSSSSYSLERKLLASGALQPAASAPNARGTLSLSPSNSDTTDRQIHAPPSPLPDHADADADDGSANPHRSIDARHVNLLRPVSVCVALTTEQVAEARQRAQSLKLGESSSSSSPLKVASLPRGLQLLVCDRHRLTRVTIDSAFEQSPIRSFVFQSWPDLLHFSSY
jgi:hypothetical protein